MMRCQISCARLGLALAVLVWAWAGGDAGHAQTLHRFGQSVQPVYEGWTQNPDGNLTMWFGYLNRNYEEEPHVPTGAGNGFAPGPADRGQPTHFYTRRQNFVLGVPVPADWGDKDLVWSLTVNGTTYQALGSLWDSWVLDEGVWRANRGAGTSGRYGGEEQTNRPPRVAIVGDQQVSATVGSALALTATASDDGLPGPQNRRPPGTYDPLPNDLPTIGGRRSGAGSGIGGPTDQNVVKVRNAFETGLAITWLHYRGPGRVTFSPMVTPVQPVDGQATTAVQFSEPGTYTIRAAADDSSYISTAEVTVVVK